MFSVDARLNSDPNATAHAKPSPSAADLPRPLAAVVTTVLGEARLRSVWMNVITAFP